MPTHTIQQPLCAIECEKCKGTQFFVNDDFDVIHITCCNCGERDSLFTADED